jgi:ABC-type sugar transport system permease subunit
VIHIFNQAFRDFRLGYASAMAYLYFIVLFVLTLVQFRYFGQQAD